MRVCGACEGGGAVARQERRGPTLSHQEEPRGPDPQTHADIQGEWQNKHYITENCRYLSIKLLLYSTGENFLHI